MSTPFRFKNADNTTVDFEDYYVRADYFRSGNLWAVGSASSTFGMLGDGTTVGKSSPVQTTAYGTNWVSVSGGYRAAHAIKSDGSLWNWGMAQFGVMGDSTTSNRSNPSNGILGENNWNQVSMKNRGTTAAIKTDGTLWLWGRNSYGSLGDNTIVNKSSPVQTIAFGTNWKQVLAGQNNSAAVKTDGTLWIWGLGTAGQLGDNTIVSKSSPVQTIAGGTNWKSVAGTGGAGLSGSIAAIKTDGTLWIWGGNANGQLGDNTSVTSRSSPVQTVAFGSNWKSVSCGYSHTAAIKTDGTLWTWGINSSGQLGDNTTTSRSSPVQTIAGGTNWKSVACGSNSSACIKTDGTLWVWGNNANGQLGDNTIVSKSSPVQTIMYGTNWKKVDFGTSAMYAIQYQDDYQ